MKKVFAIVLIVCLAMTAVFADKGDFKIGVQAGFGTDSITLTLNENYKTVTNNGGFYFAGTGEYSFSDAFAGKFEFGLNTMGKAKSTGTIVGVSKTAEASENSPLQLSAYFGLQYNIEVSKDLDIGIGAGWDMMIGKESNADDAKTNAAMGLGVEFVAAFKMNKNVALTVGSKAGFFFVNTDDQIKEDLENVNSILSLFTSDDVKVGHNAFKFFAGLTFAL